MAYEFDNRNDNKTEHAFKAFTTDLKKGLDVPVIFMYGAEDYLIEWAANTLANRYIGKAALDTDFERPDADSVSAEDIIQSCETFSMFSEKRIIWVKEYPPLYQENSKGFGDIQLSIIEEYLDSPNPGTILIFSTSRVKNDPKDRREKRTKLDKLLLKKAKCYDFCPLERRALRAFIEKRFKNAGVRITRDNVEYLIDATGYFHKDTDYKLMNLDADLKKILGLVDTSHDTVPGPISAEHEEGPVEQVETPVPEVTRESIDRAILGDMDTYVFGFLDHLSANRKEEAFLLLNNLITDGSDIYSLLGLMVNQFETMTEVRELSEDGMSNAAMAKELGIHEFRVKKAMAAANRLSLSKLKDILCQLYEIDVDIKQGNVDGALALELLIGRI